MQTSDNPSILTGWWHFAIRALTALTTPRADTDACDRAVEQLARNSLVGAAVHHASVVTRRAWTTSRFHALVSPIVAAASLRMLGWIVAVAGATALGINRLAPIPLGPLNWVVPASLVAAGLLLMVAAAPLARAAADRQLRHKVS